MLLETVTLAAGLICLYVGAEGLVGGASRIACFFGVRPLVIGLTVVAFGTSAPELLVSLFASEIGEAGLSIGNVLGSNIINISLVLGLSILLKPMAVHHNEITTELIIMVGSSILFWLLAIDGAISRVDGLVLSGSLGAYLFHRYLHASPREFQPEEEDCGSGPFRSGACLLGGTLALCLGAHLVVTSAVALAEIFEVSNTFVGLTIVAFGTSLPELAASLVATRKNESDIAIGNVVGSNIFNACMVMGTVGLISPIAVEQGLHRFEFPLMIGISFLLLRFVRRGRVLTRPQGIAFVALFIIYLGISWYLTGTTK